MNANATFGTSDTTKNNKMNATGLNPVGNELLQVIALEVVAASGDTFPPLKAAVLEALAIIGIVKKIKINEKDWAAFSGSLIQKVEEIVLATCQYNKSQVPLTWQSNFENLRCILEHMKEDVTKIQQQNLYMSIANLGKDTEHIASFQVELNALPNFQACLGVDVEGSSQEANAKWREILGDATPESNKDHKSNKRKNMGERPPATGDVAQVNMFHQAKNVQFINSVVTAANTINNNNDDELWTKIEDAADQLNVEKWLQELKAPSHGKVKDRCMPGTREDVLTLIKTWLDDLNEPNIFWLSGSPGSGKTTIASTVVADFDCFSGQFFFHRDETELRDPDNLWRRIALDLSLGSNDVKKSIAQALETQKANIRGLDISMQFEHLISKPLQQVFGTSIKPLLIVVDALDECDSYEKLLPSLISWSGFSKSFKLLITSRRYSNIQTCLGSISVHVDLHTGHEISTHTSDDLEKYFIARFTEVTRLPPKWPGPAKVSFLVRKAAGLFIWAKSAMDFILHKGGDPEERLDIISTDSGEGIDVVDSLYHQVISVALQGLRKPEKTSLKLVLGSIIIAKDPLRIKDLTELLGVKDGFLNSIIGQLSPILSISNTNYLHICHQSVVDFLLDSGRSQDLWVDHQYYSLSFAGSCLKLMNAKLKFNFFDLKTSYILNKDIPELNDHIESVKSTALDHATYFWASYLQKDCDKILQLAVQAAVEKFLMVHLLHWLEIMSLMGTVNHAAQLLLLAARWSKAIKPSLSDFAKDANRFVMEFVEPIANAVPHIYLSALPFAPRNSKISMQFLKLFQKTLIVKMGQMEDWSEKCLLRLADHDGWITSVTFSPDGRHIASGANDKTVRVWDAQTGQTVMDPLKAYRLWIYDKTIRVWDAQTGQSAMDPLKGHNDDVTSVAFSPDGRHIASGCYDKTVRVWDAQTGQIVVDPLKGHGVYVTSVACSPDGRHIVSGSDDKTVRVWDAQTGQSVMILSEDMVAMLLQLHFLLMAGILPLDLMMRQSECGMLKQAYCFWIYDKTVRVWDVQTGQSAMDPLKGHDHYVTSVAFSPNGKHIASGCYDKTVRVWDAQTGQSVVDPLKGHGVYVTSVAFSPDSRHIVSGSDDKTVRVWDAQTGQSVMTPFEGHDDYVTSVAFSPDGRHIVSGSDDKTVRVWDAQTGQSVMDPLKGHGSSVTSVAFSPDGRHIVSGSYDKTVRVWDVQTGQSAMDPIKGHDHYVTSVAFSPDGRHIASGCYDKTVRVWDAQTGQIVVDPLKGHDLYVTSVACSPDGRHIISGSDDKTVRVWDAQTVTFSPDGRHVVSGSDDKTVRVWDAQTGQSVMDPLKGHGDGVTSVAFSSDGRHIVSGSGDETVRVWDAQISSRITDPVTVSCLSTCPTASTSVSLPVTPIHSEDRNITMSDFNKTFLCDSYNKPLLEFCHHDGNWIMLPGGAYVLRVPDRNRSGLFWPRTTTVIGCTPTSLQLENFVHGVNWSQCFSSCHDPIQGSIEPIDSIVKFN
ncbi:uncharacterized protein LACBIDRAFT_381489 [Laccaria bicolor S238N-H82]|uniref:Predicted protein n=1 Tax=Laccaria bicolor (strain S238N-H82 / ATCC MYA-4686) TaxID=486041 RepID=B0CWJ8_LACBS|nr:uncharacterized protein LACBIDRAFT_381489 [Laccaria bicolor S238N-H82]EDR13080.1 predicted protein [Laccaria bicolor S238N-H82]|eukprot:XP_001875578.1 predicted protein [Laccaria bicolor S238N-H82]